MPTKITITGIDIFTGKKYVDSFPAHATVNCPIVTKTQYTFIGVDNDGYAILMDDNSQIKDNIKCHAPYPAENSTVTVISALNNESLLKNEHRPWMS